MANMPRTFDAPSIIRRTTEVHQHAKPNPLQQFVDQHFTKIELGKKRKRPVEDENMYESTRGRSTIFETLKDKRNTTDDLALQHQKKLDYTKQIQAKVKKLYRDKIDESENHHKTIKACAYVLPKIDSFIRNDTTNTSTENKLTSTEYQSKKYVGYLCAPQLSIVNSHKLPTVIQETLFKELEDESSEAFYGIIPEIDIAFTVIDNVFNYWNISSKSNVIDHIQLKKQILSVGFVKPPQGFFHSLK